MPQFFSDAEISGGEPFSSPAQRAGWMFNNLGWSPAQSAGIVGNLQHESGFNPTITGDGGSALGVAQWHPDRIRGLVNFARKNNLNPEALDTQLLYVNEELKTTESAAGNKLKQAQTVPQAVDAMTGFERPSGWSPNNPQGSAGYGSRMQFAQAAMDAPSPQANPAQPKFFSDEEISAPQSEGWSDLFSADTAKKALAAAPADAANTVAGIAKQNVDPGMSVNFGYQLATNPELRQELVQHFANYLTPEGIKKNVTEHPIGTALDASLLVAPLSAPKRAAAIAEESAAPVIRSAADLKSAGGTVLNVAKDSGVYFTPEAVNPIADTLETIAKKRNFRPGREGSTRIEEVLKDVNSMRDRPWSWSDMQQLNQDLNDAWIHAKRNNRSDYAGIAGEMRSATNKFIKGVQDAKGEGLYATGDLTPEQASNLYLEGNKIYRQAKVAEGLDKMMNMARVDAAQFAQSGEANALRKYARQVLRRHYSKGDTGLRSDEIKTLEDFNKGRMSEWWLKQARRIFSGAFGTILGAQVGGPLGAGAAWLLGKAVARRADRIAVERFTKLRDSVLQNGSDRLQELLGEAVHNHINGTPAGRSAITRWTSSLGNGSIKSASKALAVVVAQQVKQPQLAPRIEMELNRLAQQIQGSVETQAQPDQQ